MKQESPQKRNFDIETQGTESLSQTMETGPDDTFGDIIEKVKEQPNLYYFELQGNSAIVRKRADDTQFYMTVDPAEVEALKFVGIEKNPKI